MDAHPDTPTTSAPTAPAPTQYDGAYIDSLRNTAVLASVNGDFRIVGDILNHTLAEAGPKPIYAGLYDAARELLHLPDQMTPADFSRDTYDDLIRSAVGDLDDWPEGRGRVTFFADSLSRHVPVGRLFEEGDLVDPVIDGLALTVIVQALLRLHTACENPELVGPSEDTATEMEQQTPWDAALVEMVFDRWGTDGLLATWPPLLIRPTA